MRIPSTSNTRASGVPQGTLGGMTAKQGTRAGGRSLHVGDEMYLWVLVFLEVGTLAFLRKQFRRHHGG